MPIIFILSLVVLVASIITGFIWLKTKSTETERPTQEEGEERYEYQGRLERWTTRQERGYLPGWVPQAIFAFFLLLLLMSSLTMVGTKNYGVVTTFGAPSDDTLDSGIAFKLPWQKVTDIDATIQPDSYTGKSAFPIRIGNGSIAKIDVTIRWRIVGAKANELFQDYRSKDKEVTPSVRDALIKRELNSALNEVFGTYDPLAAVKGGENVTVDSLSSDVEIAMRQRVEKLGRDGAQVEVLSVTTPLIILDPNTQEKIDLYQSQVALTRIAEERIQTNKQEALANAEIETSIDNPLVLANKCLGIMETLAKNGGVPAGMYCFPGGNAPVVVPGTSSSN